MKQVLQNLRSGETIVQDVPVPTPQAGEALVQTAVSLVSAGTERMLVEFAEKSLVGKARSRPDLVRQVIDKARRDGFLTTLKSSLNRLDQPMVLGYSSAGTIIALGEGLQGFQVGQRVACAGGGYAVHAEYVTVPKNLLAALPDSLDFEAAAFTTLAAIALHGFRLAHVQVGERIAIIGLGLLGLLTLEIAIAAGCAVLGVDLDERRVTLANQLGAQAVLRSRAVEAVQNFSRGRGCDAVLICADTPSPDPVELAGQVARDRAHVIAVGAVGLRLPRKIYYEKELTFINSRSYGPGRYDPAYEETGQDYPIGYVRWTENRNMEAVIDLMAAGNINVQPLISHRFPIAQAVQAYELITGRRQEPCLAVLLTYDQESETMPSVNLAVDKSSTFQTVNLPAYKPAAVSTVKLGVLGAGNFASAVMLPVLRKVNGLELVGIASASGVNAQHAANRFGFKYAASEAERILNDPEINAVVILTRHHLHARQVVAGLEAGKHVFCEKPLALSEDELERIFMALQRDNAPMLMVGFNRRFAPLTERLSKFLNERQEPLVVNYRVNAGYIPLTHWTQDLNQGGGRIIGEGCHFIDFLSFLVGAPPLSVQALGLPDRGRYREDNVVMIFRFADDSIGSISYLANGDKSFSKERVEVFCAGRVAVLDDFRTLEMVNNGQRQSVLSRLRQDKGHLAEWQKFTAALKAGDSPPISYDHLLGVTRASFAAIRALRTGQEQSIR